MVKKLVRRPRHHEAMVRVIRHRLVPPMRPLPARVEIIFPNQSVRESEGVLLKLKRTQVLSA